MAIKLKKLFNFIIKQLLNHNINDFQITHYSKSNTITTIYNEIQELITVK